MPLLTGFLKMPPSPPSSPSALVHFPSVAETRPAITVRVLIFQVKTKLLIGSLACGSLLQNIKVTVMRIVTISKMTFLQLLLANNVVERKKEQSLLRCRADKYGSVLFSFS